MPIRLGYVFMPPRGAAGAYRDVAEFGVQIAYSGVARFVCMV